ncbi:MAG: TetR/AcrR family transcriptional regulator [Oceanococcus sp.]
MMSQAPNTLNTRTRFLVAAIDLFQAQGYHQTGLNQIIEAADAPKGSLYHYFPKGKEQLACEAIKVASNEVLTALMGTVMGAHSAAEVVKRMLSYFTAQMTDSNYRKGCPIATITLEQAGKSELIREACQSAYGSWTNTLSSVLATFKVATPDDVAQVVLSTIEGALILSKTQRSTVPLENAAALLTDLMHLKGNPTP